MAQVIATDRLLQTQGAVRQYSVSLAVTAATLLAAMSVADTFCSVRKHCILIVVVHKSSALSHRMGSLDRFLSPIPWLFAATFTMGSRPWHITVDARLSSVKGWKQAATVPLLVTMLLFFSPHTVLVTTLATCYHISVALPGLDCNT